MDTGVQLGRRFRALKLWMILRSLGTRGVREHLARHIHLAQQFAGWVDGDPHFERMAPVPFSVVCFRWNPTNPANRANPANLENPDLDVLNNELLQRVNANGAVFLSATRLRGSVALRIAIGNLRTDELHVRRAWELLQHHARELER